MTEQEVIERLKVAVDAAGGQRAFARVHGLSVGYINDVLHGKRTLSERVLATIGMQRQIMHIVTYHEIPMNVAANVAVQERTDTAPHQEAK